MSICDQDIENFLSPTSWAQSVRIPLKGDASFRSYIRLKKPDETAILMCAPPPNEQTIPFMSVAQYLLSCGLSAPHIIHSDSALGLVLLEDFGDNLLCKKLVHEPQNETMAYEMAVDTLSILQKNAPPAILTHKGQSHTLPVYNDKLLFKEVDLFTEWYCDKGLLLNAQYNKAEWQGIWQKLFDKLPAPSILTLRDYHSENIIWLEGREHAKKIGLLDFQDAALGHRSYDLLSLLQDARRIVSPALEKAMINHFIGQNRALDADKFIEEYNILAAQRNCKIIGIFTRLWMRDKKPAYPAMIPHVWQLLERDLTHPTLHPLKQFLEGLIPPSKRGQIIGATP